jgi:hypothetical protein
VVGHNAHTSFCGWEAIGLCFGLMHPWRPWILLATLAAFAGQAAVIYKWTDSDGVVHYSDQSVPGAEKIFTTSSPSAGTSGTPSAANAATPAAKKTVPALAYDQFSITSPAPQQSFFGDEVIGVHLALQPSLKPDQSITWHLNGKELSDQGNGATQFTLPHLDRGTYVIAATITDPASGASVSTDSVSFFVRQPSELSPQHK